MSAISISTDCARMFSESFTTSSKFTLVGDGVGESSIVDGSTDSPIEGAEVSARRSSTDDTSIAGGDGGGEEGVAVGGRGGGV